MRFPVTDDAVRDFAERLRSGIPTGNPFPGKMSDCDFTPDQRAIISGARIQRRSHLKTLKAEGTGTSTDSSPQLAQTQKNKPKTSGLTKLERMLYLQGGKCFFCGELLVVADASIDPLLPLSQAGQRVESNEVVCHKSVNEAFGAMDLKRKMEFILRSSGRFYCPEAKKTK